MPKIANPILRGFNPDPSIVRVNDDYYIATSTFEWFPGVQIHHSRDLVHWRLITHPLTRVSQLDMLGVPDSGGIWAPCLTHSDGLFYLVYTNVLSYGEPYVGHNYVVTAPDIMGPWSEPIYLNSSGFDPSMFHDDDGRKWVVNRFCSKGGGILLQEYSPEQRALIGTPEHIFNETPLGMTEAPHIYKHNGYYYLMVAEGGTEYNHAVTVARSTAINGPYEVDPQNPMLTSAHAPDIELQKAGHASIAQAQNGDWYMVHLCGRPRGEERRCLLGRETAIQKVEWSSDNWLRLVHGGSQPIAELDAPDLPEHSFAPEPERDDFNSQTLSVHLNSLRVPVDDSWLSLTERPGWLRLRGRVSLQSYQNQSLIARRLQAFSCEAETCMEFEPDNDQQAAGLICLYNTRLYHYLYVSRNRDGQKLLSISSCNAGSFNAPLQKDVIIDGWERVYLKACVNYPRLVFQYSQDGESWQAIGSELDATILTDEYALLSGYGWFTGAFFGLCAQDLSGKNKHADFDYFIYREG